MASIAASADPLSGPLVTLGPIRTDPGRAELVIRASPSWAKITIDDKPVDNPALASYPKDGSTHRIVAKAWGYETKSTNVTVTADTIVDLGLDRHAAASGPVVASAAPPRAPARRPSESPAPQSDTAIKPSAAPSTPELSAGGGRAPLHPIETKDPYGGGP
jgi:hypothetical protein